MMYTAKQLINAQIVKNALNDRNVKNEYTLEELLQIFDVFRNFDGDDSELINKYGIDSCDIDSARNNFRTSGELLTEIELTYSRHFETETRYANLFGNWVGWTRYFGGGKYAEPEAIDFEDDAVLLNLELEQEIIVVKRKFSVVN